MHKTLIIHGRQPELGQAELESLYGAAAIRPVGDIATALDISPELINPGRLGGMVRLCEISDVLDTTDWTEIERFLLKTLPGRIAGYDEGKLTLGLSVYGISVPARRITATGLELKKTIRNTGRAVRLVPNKTPELNSAQVIHNKLAQSGGLELIFVRSGSSTIIARTIAVQDIEAYAARDQARPHRDARVGMLPPKLAQIIINLAAGDAKPPFKVYDAFCGTGVILQEALLMGYTAGGSDIDPRMVEYSQKNLQWLAATQGDHAVKEADATEVIFDADCIASEVFLGRPLSSLPDKETMRKIIGDCDVILAKFLRNVARQTKPGFRMCLAVPAWIRHSNRPDLLPGKTRNSAGTSGTGNRFSSPMLRRSSTSTASSASQRENGSSTQLQVSDDFWHLPTLEKLSQLGYNRLKFAHAKQEKLIYHRPDQVVARELIIIERK